MSQHATWLSGSTSTQGSGQITHLETKEIDGGREKVEETLLSSPDRPGLCKMTSVSSLTMWDMHTDC